VKLAADEVKRRGDGRSERRCDVRSERSLVTVFDADSWECLEKWVIAGDVTLRTTFFLLKFAELKFKS
jgi:hypothetical protein